MCVIAMTSSMRCRSPAPLTGVCACVCVCVCVYVCVCLCPLLSKINFHLLGSTETERRIVLRAPLCKTVAFLLIWIVCTVWTGGGSALSPGGLLTNVEESGLPSRILWGTPLASYVHTQTLHYHGSKGSPVLCLCLFTLNQAAPA